MTLKQLATLLPGYVTLYVHSDTEGWTCSVGAVLCMDDLNKAVVVRAIPLAPYTMEIYIEFKEETT